MSADELIRLVEAHGVSATARQLGISHQAVSARLKRRKNRELFRELFLEHGPEETARRLGIKRKSVMERAVRAGLHVPSPRLKSADRSKMCTGCGTRFVPEKHERCCSDACRERRISRRKDIGDQPVETLDRLTWRQRQAIAECPADLRERLGL